MNRQNLWKRSKLVGLYKRLLIRPSVRGDDKVAADRYRLGGRLLDRIAKIYTRLVFLYCQQKPYLQLRQSLASGSLTYSQAVVRAHTFWNWWLARATPWAIRNFEKKFLGRHSAKQNGKGSSSDCVQDKEPKKENTAHRTTCFGRSKD